MRFKQEIKIALLAIVGIVLLFFGLQFLKGLSVVSDDKQYFVEINDVNGITPSVGVFANGYKVGVVDAVDFDYSNSGKSIIRISVDKKLQIPVGSKIEVSSDMLGNLKVNIALGANPLNTIEPGDTLKGGMENGILAKAADMVPQVEKMLPKIDSILTSLNALLADPSLRSILQNVDNTTANLYTASGQLNTLMTAMNKQVPSLLNKTNNVMANTEQLTSNLSNIDVDGMMSKVNATLKDVNELTAKLNSDKGTIGALMNDRSLYNNLSSTMFHADSLMIDLKQHPKRYVHFSIFGKKDK